MSSKAADHTIICPNCGSPAAGNYCPQCGQATHLHKDTFWGLVTHFIAHYFHFESKFWQTMRTLMAKPGALTVAYLAKQRARYVPPMSLYIFVAVVVFLLSTLLQSGYEKLGWVSPEEDVQTEEVKPPKKVSATQFGRLAARIRVAIDDPEFISTLDSYIPKAFFLMIPILAIILRLLLIGNKASGFVPNTICALHFQSAAFILLFAGEVLPFIPTVILFLASVVYMVLALRRVYALKTGRAIWTALGASILYLIALFAILTVLLLTVFSLTRG